MSKQVLFEAEGPNGAVFRFMAPENSTPEQLARYAAIEYQLRMGPKATESPASTEQAGPPTAPPAPPLLAPPQDSLPPAEAKTSEDDFDARMKQLERQQNIGQAQMFGGGAGAGLAASRVARDLGLEAAQAIGNRAEQGRIAAQRTLGAAPSLPGTPEQATRILQGGPGDTLGTTGRARGTGYNIETAQQAARTREVDALLRGLQQRGAVGSTSSQLLAEAPGLTATPSGVLVPREMAGKPPVPPKVPALDQVSGIFMRMMGPVARYALPPVALAGAAGEAVRGSQQLEEGDKFGASLSGISALGGLASLFPPAAPVAIPVSLGAGALQYGRSRLEPNLPVTPVEELYARRPAFGVYPKMKSKSQPRPVR